MLNPRPRLKTASRFAQWVIVGLLLLYTLLAGWAAREQCATFDEPVHATAAWLHLRHGNFQCNMEHPPLWKYWAALPNGPAALNVDLQSPQWRAVQQLPRLQQEWCFNTLYRTPGVRPDDFIFRSRLMLLLLAAALGAVTALWAWRLGGPLAGLTATALFALDPNFLGHGALVTNDVACALALTALAFSVWRLGQRATWGRVAGVALLCALGPLVKFTALLFLPLAALLLGFRACLPTSWEFCGRVLERRRSRLLAAALQVLLIGVTSFALLWAGYGFRFRPAPASDTAVNIGRMVAGTRELEVLARHPDVSPTRQELSQWRPGPVLSALQLANDRRLLPQAWLGGMMFAYGASRFRPSFLCGQYSTVGWWYYFPLAMLFKTPTLTLVAFLLCGAVGVAWLARSRPGLLDERWWSLGCLLAPPAVFLVAAMASRLNIGLRHVLPVYPFLFILCGIAAGMAWRRWRRPCGLALGVVMVGLALETALAAPHYLSFFNTPSGGARGGLRLLGDSNLDWGQDLNLLAAWQRVHPSEKLYLCYFGEADPAYYGIRYTNLPGGSEHGPAPELPREAGVLAVSATHLQGIYFDPSLRRIYAPLRRKRPLAVLGGSIYLFPFAGRNGAIAPAER